MESRHETCYFMKGNHQLLKGIAMEKARAIRKKVTRILNQDQEAQALEALAAIPEDTLTGPLFHHLYNLDELIKHRSAVAMAHLVTRLIPERTEKARIIMRRILWNLNDESGGIGWGSPEAMGAILTQSPKMAEEYRSILFSYLEPGGTYIENELLQRGVIWGIGTYLEVAPKALETTTCDQLYAHLSSEDKIKRAHALRALINARAFDCKKRPRALISDQAKVPIFRGWAFDECRISDMAHACIIE